MSTTSPILPLDLSEGAIASYTDDQIERLVKQNVKMILLTFPGERIMFPNFGVGIQSYLFEMQNAGVGGQIRTAVATQLNRWLPSVNLLAISTSQPESNPNTLAIRIEYQIDFLGTKDFLDLLFEY
ncbi:MAG: baseplate protein [Pelagibacteraceae bacterium TMED247]|nr:MAG: baseplate protein [Pelagibacteraceae bacterium TMED247]|tara:strand:- start:7097 stop:7474 length:378 start_codon:yes stop_codon:yes gene_type:complete